MRTLKPYTWLERPLKSSKDLLMNVAVMVPDNHKLREIEGPKYNQKPDEHYGNPMEGYCGGKCEDYTVTRIILVYEKFEGIRNPYPLTYSFPISGADYTSDECIQVIVKEYPAQVHHLGTSSGHVGDAD